MSSEFEFKDKQCMGCGKQASSMDQEGWKCLKYPKCRENYEMTQEEVDELRKFRVSNSVSMGMETGWTRDERYILNKIRYDHIQKLNQMSR